VSVSNCRIFFKDAVGHSLADSAEASSPKSESGWRRPKHQTPASYIQKTLYHQVKTDFTI
jgi:hypothetical protein